MYNEIIKIFSSRANIVQSLKLMKDKRFRKTPITVHKTRKRKKVQ